MRYYLRLKDCGDSRFIYFEYLEEIPQGGWYLSTCKRKYAEPFESLEEAKVFKLAWDDLDHFDIITEEEFNGRLY